MALPVYVTGQVLAASDCNEFFMWKAAYKTADQSVTSSTVLQADNTLLFAATANATYYLEAILHLAYNASFGFQFDWSLPTGATMKYDAAISGSFTLETAGTPDFSTSAVGVMEMRGAAVIGANAGNVTLMWAQHASGATPTTVSATSFLTARRIS